ncbi:bifunctional metallophosphatase/5'-nucleotidase [Kineococcus indalonis]|uniref:bifunctional metallophosphatase/5'-nucleotidase n=1 Tax=Kineococcus indalonis TaxID=2696566 RepID=UPI001412A228|nr:bifunctional UDP-sugar hydrolase/5'-nucleotidase [Kineococcus indalonis]NAZ86097.1 bifunctional metallophosphatase/5'-nucleotidase [Kineococcus indalonis]
MSRPLLRLVGPAAGLVAFTGSLGVVCAGLAPAALAATATVSPTATATATATAAPAPVPAGQVGALLPAPAAGQTQVQIGAFNDLHGRLEAPDETDDGAPIGGAAQLAGALDAMRAQQPNTVVASVGDNIGASTFTSFIQQDAPTLEALDAMGVAASAVGNHEFDKGYEDLTGRVDELAGFPYLGANVLRADGSPALDAYDVVDVGGVSVGFVGVVTQATPSLVAPDGIRGLRFTDPVAATNRVAAQLSDGDAANGEADVVVLLAHEGSEGTDCEGVRTSGEFGKIVQGASAQVDAILSGHTHVLYDCEYPVAGKRVARPVLSAESYSVAVDRLVLNVDDATGEVVAQAHQVLPVEGFAPDAGVQAIVEEAVAFAEEEGARPVGRITTDVKRAFAGAEDDRGTQSPLANLIADAQLQQTRGAGAQIALMNPGGVRDDLDFAQSGTEGDGVVTYAEAAAVQPFANSVVTVTLTGAQVRRALEQQWQPAGSSRPVLALGVSRGFSFTYDPAAPAGQRITSVTLDGVPLDPAAPYRVTVNSFLASGGDNFTALAEGSARTELGRTDLEAFTAFLGLPENQGLTADQRPRSAVAAAPAPSPTATAPAPTGAPAPSPTSAAPLVPVVTRPTATPPAARPTTRPLVRPTSRPAAVSGRLAHTGTDVAPYAAGGAGLVLVGGVLLALSRRRAGARG